MRSHCPRDVHVGGPSGAVLKPHPIPTPRMRVDRPNVGGSNPRLLGHALKPWLGLLGWVGLHPGWIMEALGLDAKDQPRARHRLPEHPSAWGRIWRGWRKVGFRGLRFQRLPQVPESRAGCANAHP